MTVSYFKAKKNDAICEITENSDGMHIEGYRESTPAKRQIKAVSRDQAVQIAEAMRKSPVHTIIFDQNAI